MKLMNYPGIFFHGIDLNIWYPCHNLSLGGKIWSPDFLPIMDNRLKNLHTSLREVEIEDIKNYKLPANFPSPRTRYILYEALKLKYAIKSGEIKTDELNDSQRQILKLGEIEINFEEIRRNINTETASRLTCLWVAEFSDKGREHLKEMLGEDIFIFKVRLPLIKRVTKVDTRWFDEYFENSNNKLIEEYWKGNAYNKQEQSWEYLVEGIIEIVEKKDVDYIIKNGKKLPGFLNKYLTNK